MLPFAWDIGRRVRPHGVAVWRLHYRFRGWNAPEESPVFGARWVLDEVRRRHGDLPVVLLGHSMGGRVAVNVSAPHGPASGPPGPMASGGRDGGRREWVAGVLILHGDKDRTTSLEASKDWAGRARTASTLVEVRRIRGGEHTMIRQARLWHQLTHCRKCHPRLDRERSSVRLM